MAAFHQMARTATAKSLKSLKCGIYDSDESDDESDHESGINTAKGTIGISDSTSSTAKDQYVTSDMDEAPSTSEPDAETASDSAEVAEESDEEVVDQNGKAVFKLKIENSGRRELHSPTSKSSDEDSEIQLFHKVAGTPYSGYINFTTKYKSQPNSHPRVKRDGDACFERMSQIHDEEEDNHYEFDY